MTSIECGFEVGKKYVKDKSHFKFTKAYVEVSKIEKDRIFGRTFIKNGSHFSGGAFELLDHDGEKMWLIDLHDWTPFVEQ